MRAATPDPPTCTLTTTIGQADRRTFGLDICLAATTEAVTNAVAALKELDPSSELVFPFPTDEPSGSSTSSPPSPPRFDRIWTAYAGCTRDSDRALLLPPLTSLLGELRLTGDGELLTAPVAGRRRFITLICGTGSLGLLWAHNAEGGVRQLARSGGWGPLLADEGSGWALGKEAVKSVLTFAANRKPLLGWHGEVLAHFGLDAATGADRLITASSRLDPNLPPSEGDSERKKRIAACSRIVVGAAERGDGEAKRLLRVAARQVCETLEALVAEAGGEECALVVAGGLGQVDIFWREVEDMFAHRGWKWAEVVKVDEPGRSGIEALLRAA